MIVNLWDSDGLDESWEHTAPRNNVARIVAGPQEPLENIFRRVIDASQGPLSIWLLRILSHGNTAFIDMGRDDLSIRTVDRLSALRNYFSSNAIGIAIHSCGPASATNLCVQPDWFDQLTGEDENGCHVIAGNIVGGDHRHGLDFLRSMSQASGTTVRGALHAQIPDSRFRFEGISIAVSRYGQSFVVPDRGRLALDTTRIF